MSREIVAVWCTRPWDKGGRKLWRSGTLNTIVCPKSVVLAIFAFSLGRWQFLQNWKIKTASLSPVSWICHCRVRVLCLTMVASTFWHLGKKTALSSHVQVWACLSVQEHAWASHSEKVQFCQKPMPQCGFQSDGSILSSHQKLIKSGCTTFSPAFGALCVFIVLAILIGV